MADWEKGLQRWSRLKRQSAARAEKSARRRETAAPLDPAQSDREAPPADPDGAAPGQTQAPSEPADPAEALPDIDSLTAESDFTPFMREGVPEALRVKALRKLWRLDPVLANVDGLVDYGEDFTDAAKATGIIKTAYKVGRGMLGDPEPERLPEPADAETQQASMAEAAPEEGEATRHEEAGSDPQPAQESESEGPNSDGGGPAPRGRG